jgi:hypothetical protein
LREALSDPASGGVDFVETPDSVAADIGEAIAEIGGDGFVITEGLTRRTFGEITDGLAPALQRRRPLRCKGGLCSGVRRIHCIRLAHRRTAGIGADQPLLRRLANA